MNAYDKLNNIQKKNNSVLAIGLDTDLQKIPAHFNKEPASLFEFNKAIIEATKDVCAAYKINFAFYEQYGSKGYEILEKTFDIIPTNIFTIADAKRADIGNTSACYAKSVFEHLNADAITINAYMGFDSLSPFFEYTDKMCFILALTSNPGSFDFQKLFVSDSYLYQKIISTSMQWAGKEQLGYVAGGTHYNELADIRQRANDRVLLVPGIGAQGANITQVKEANNNGSLLIAASRSVIYASSKSDFADIAKSKAIEMNKEYMNA